MGGGRGGSNLDRVGGDEEMSKANVIAGDKNCAGVLFFVE